MNSISDDSVLGKRAAQDKNIAIAHHDLISFLAIAQKCEVNILPILWQPTLHLVGWGATSTINQSLINIHTKLAFKRTSSYLSTNSGSARDVSKTDFERLISEVLILRHPLIRNHANIIDLEGICWESDGVWPVFVFEMAQLGDLQVFIDCENGGRVSLTLETALGLCTDIAMAILALHDCNIVHGDIKPKNILIFKDEKGELLAKLTDFGHSCFGTSEDDLVYLPRSRPWTDPNWDDDCFEISEAKRMD